MAMGFALANRAENPDLVRAMMGQAQIDGQQRALKQNKNQMMMEGGMQVADATGAFDKLAGLGMTGGADVITPTLIGEGGAMASAAPVAADALMGTAAGAVPEAAAASAGMGPMGFVGLGLLAYNLLKKDD